MRPYLTEETKMSRRPLTTEELTALQRFAAQNGRTWKSKLNELWASGRNENSGPLRTIRNDFGPSWLAKFKLLNS